MIVDGQSGLHSSWFGAPAAADTLVVGGGFAGLASAVALAQHGLSVEVIEARGAAATPRAFRGELIHPRGVEALCRLGVDLPAASSSTPIRGLQVQMRSKGDRVVLDYAGGRHGVVAEHDTWLSVIKRRVADTNAIRVTHGDAVDRVLLEGADVAGVQLRSGAMRRARLTVFCDGRNSQLSKWISIPATRVVNSRTLVITLPLSLRESARGLVFVGGPGPALVYQVRLNTVRMCIDLPLGYARGDSIAAFDRLGIDFGPHLPAELSDALREGGWRQTARTYPNVSVLVSNRRVNGLAIVGDAACCTHPLTASGMTRALVQIEGIVHGLPNSRALRKSAAIIRPDSTVPSSLLADTLPRILAGADPAADALRNGLFSYWSSPQRRAGSIELATLDRVSPVRLIVEYTLLVRCAFRRGRQSRQLSTRELARSLMAFSRQFGIDALRRYRTARTRHEGPLRRKDAE